MKVTVLKFKVDNAEELVEEILSLPDVKTDILGGLDYHSSLFGEILDSQGNPAYIWIDTDDFMDTNSGAIFRIEYYKAKAPEPWLMRMLFNFLEQNETGFANETRSESKEIIR